MMKKVINIFLLLLVTVQMLPVKEIGEALFNNAFTEEIAHSISVDDIGGGKSFTKSFYLCADFSPKNIYQILISNSNIFFQDTVPQNYSTEILVPPPNC